MQAIRRRGGMLSLETIFNRDPRDDEALVRVVRAGICRTDLYIAAGRFPSAVDPLTLGHEFAGVVESVGKACKLFSPGDPVTADPEIACGLCRSCREGPGFRCVNPSLIGLDRDGGFADNILLPESSLHRLPKGLPFELGAYTEPVAAARAVLRVPLDPSRQGIILGRNRIASLVERILLDRGFRNLRTHEPAQDGPLEPSSLDFAIETSATPESLALLVRALAPGGTLVLKSRPATPVPIDVREAVRKSLRLEAVSYGDFDEAVRWVVEAGSFLHDLVGQAFPLDAFESAFAAARSAEDRKIFFAPSGT